jgi:hypothetical protein
VRAPPPKAETTQPPLVSPADDGTRGVVALPHPGAIHSDVAEEGSVSSLAICRCKHKPSIAISWKIFDLFANSL